MNILKKTLVFIGKIFGYGFIFCSLVFLVFTISLFYFSYLKESTRNEICEQAIVGQKFDFEKIIPKYRAEGVLFTFKKGDEQVGQLAIKNLDAESIEYFTGMTGYFSFSASASFDNYFTCRIFVKDGIVESKKQ